MERQNKHTLFRVALLMAVASLMLASCTKTVYVPTVVTEKHATSQTDSLTRFISRLIEQTNSSKERETVYVYENSTEKVTVNESGDTTRVERERERVTDRTHELESKVESMERELDSLRNAKNRMDSIDRPVPYPVEVVREVPRTRGWWETLLLWLGGLLLAATVGAGIWWWKQHTNPNKN